MRSENSSLRRENFRSRIIIIVLGYAVLVLLYIPWSIVIILQYHNIHEYYCCYLQIYMYICYIWSFNSPLPISIRTKVFLYHCYWAKWNNIFRRFQHILFLLYYSILDVLLYMIIILLELVRYLLHPDRCFFMYFDNNHIFF